MIASQLLLIIHNLFQLVVPVHLSAAILQGPNSADASHPPVDPQRFLRLAKTHCPKATLVLGWTDSSPSNGDQHRYTWDMVMAMQTTVEHWKLHQPVSFSVRASLAKLSLPQIKWLMEMTDKSSVTIIAPKGDEMPVMDLLHIRSKLPRNRVLYDLHTELLSQFDPIKDQGMESFNAFKQANVHAMEQRTSVLTPDITFRGNEWNVAEGGASQKVYLGTQSVVLQQAMLISKQPVISKTAHHLKIYGRVEFFNIDKSAVSSEIAVDILLYAPQRMKQGGTSGLKCRIQVDGTMSITSSDNKVSEMHVAGIEPCFMFVIQLTNGANVDMRVTRPMSCDQMPDTIGQGMNAVTLVELATANMQFDQHYIAIRQGDEKSFVAVDQFKVEI